MSAAIVLTDGGEAVVDVSAGEGMLGAARGAADLLASARRAGVADIGGLAFTWGAYGVFIGTSNQFAAWDHDGLDFYIWAEVSSTNMLLNITIEGGSA